ncbi:hypothetical protein KJ980_02430 [Patescibacteria group bacterium]|nr:hypothetical protein [Patescibacteria group bacterium]
MDKKFLYKIIDIGLVVIIILGYLGYKYYQQISLSTPSTPNVFVWKMYKNTTLGYEFKYPDYLPVDSPPFALSAIYGYEQQDKYDAIDEEANEKVKAWPASGSNDFKCIRENLPSTSNKSGFWYACTGEGGPYGLKAVIKGNNRTIIIASEGGCGLSPDLTEKSGCLKTFEHIRTFLSSFTFINSKDE